jgi:NDP-4-keto-2,6-dideoxyhexose 3-C-methyltransferase
VTSYTRITHCRVCGNPDLVRVLDLGEQMLTGVFPTSRDADVTRGPLRLVKCVGPDHCGLLQLEHSYSLGEMYGDNYGYRSGLNASMVTHLAAKVERIRSLIDLHPGDLVVDIGANDGTTLGHYPQETALDLVGVDPTGSKFHQYYKPGVQLIPDFFSADLVETRFPGRKARVVTSFSMFYDLEAPLDFVRQVHRILADDGIWVFEQSYMPMMLATNSYDTVCHEHLEFYALKQIQWMAAHGGFRIVDVEFNDVNGGSFSVTVAKSADPTPSADVAAILERERREGLDGLEPFHAFAERVAASKQALTAFLDRAHAQGKHVAALGASTKGNVLLQYCGIGPDRISAVGEVNPEKYGRLTPGSFLPIVPEAELLARRPDYLIVLPWHFRTFFESSEMFRDTRLVFPLPELEGTD